MSASGDYLSIASTLSCTSLDTIKTRPTDPRDAGQFNTSSNRMSVSLETTDRPRNVRASLTARYVNGYMFRSATVWGRLPTYGTIDLSANYRFPSGTTSITLQAQNLAGCVGGFSTPPATGISSTAMATYESLTRCRVGQRHVEQLNMPALGPTVFVGVRKEWR